jgi:SulP family sulfate permease
VRRESSSTSGVIGPAPLATLAATIVVAVLSLADFGALKHTWQQGRSDFVALLVTLLATLGVGVETGLAAGVLVSLALHLLRTSRPHIAEVGRVPGTEHFRNVLRHETLTHPALLSLRIDESLYFANARTLEDHINAVVAGRPELVHVVLQCSAVNDIDSSALDSLLAIDLRLRQGGLKLHLSDVKGPVMDMLKRSDFLKHLSGEVYLSHYQAVSALSPHTCTADAVPQRPSLSVQPS